MQVKNRIALLQFHTTPSKSQNISTARQNILTASKAGARLCVLPECWNSPYATAAFPEYAESLPNTGDDCTNSESAKMLMEMAKSTNMYIVGGSVPEISSGKLYNTCLVIDPTGVVVGKHRKVHLFDVDVPGGIRFRESETLCAGDGVTYFDVDAGEGGLGRIGVGIWCVQN
jgi:omega-amidase